MYFVTTIGKRTLKTKSWSQLVTIGQMGLKNESQFYISHLSHCDQYLFSTKFDQFWLTLTKFLFWVDSSSLSNGKKQVHELLCTTSDLCTQKHVLNDLIA